jgi:hypothetical protein
MTRQLVVGGHVIRQLIGLVGLQNCLVSGCEFERTVGRSDVAVPLRSTVAPMHTLLRCDKNCYQSYVYICVQYQE